MLAGGGCPSVFEGILVGMVTAERIWASACVNYP